MVSNSKRVGINSDSGSQKLNVRDWNGNGYEVPGKWGKELWFGKTKKATYFYNDNAYSFLIIYFVFLEANRVFFSLGNYMLQSELL